MQNFITILCNLLDSIRIEQEIYKLDETLALVPCLKSDLIQGSEPETLLLSPLTLAMPLTLILLIKPLPLTLESDVILDIGPGLIYSGTHCKQKCQVHRLG